MYDPAPSFWLVHNYYMLHELLHVTCKKTVHEQGYTCISQSKQQQFDTCNKQANQPIEMASSNKSLANLLR